MKVDLHLDARAADVAQWSRGEAPAELLKENGARAVWRVDAGSPALYVKRFPPELFRDRARKEAGLLLELHKAGIPCPKLVAVARDDAGSYLITEEIPRVRTLASILVEGGPEGRALLAPLGALTRRLHDAGFDHQDFHVGNVLVQDRNLFVIDVHRARRARSLSRARKLDAIAFMALSFIEKSPLTDLVRFVRACGYNSRPEQVEVWNHIRRARDRYYSGRLERCFREGTGFGVKDKIVYRKEIDLPELLGRLKSGRHIVVKEKKGETLSRVEDSLFVKKTSPGRARAIWRNAHGLALRRIDTPRLWACGPGWVAGEWIESVDLHSYVKTAYGMLDRDGRRAFLARFARMVRRMHDLGIRHADLKAGNVLVGADRIVAVDLDRVRFSLETSEKDRVFGLAQLNASVTPPLTRTDRLRFLHLYLGNCRTLWKKKSAWVREIMRITIARRHHWPPR